MTSKLAELLRRAAGVVADQRSELDEMAAPLPIEGELEAAAAALESGAAAEAPDTAAALMLAPQVEWDARVTGMTAGELSRIEDQVTARAERAARLAGYLRGRGATGCGDGGHARGVAGSNHLAYRVRKVLGFTNPYSPINF